MQRLLFTFSFLIVLTACAPATAQPVAPTPQVLSVYASPATEPWLEEVYNCAEQNSIVISLAASTSSADLSLRFGEPEQLSTPAFQIGSDDLLIVTHPESPIQNLTVDEARALFLEGQENAQVWVYASGADVQEVFEREVMPGSSIHSLARLAAHPQQMSDVVNAEKDAVGLLPRRWKTGAAREVFSLPNIPILVITPGEPQGAAQEIIACLQQ